LGMPCLEGGSDNINLTSTSDVGVLIGNYGFHPETVTVKAGTTVTWINMDFVGHNIESGTEQQPNELFQSQILNHMQSFSYTFSNVGEYSYHCDPHPYMEGKIIVVS